MENCEFIALVRAYRWFRLSQPHATHRQAWTFAKSNWNLFDETAPLLCA